MNDEEPPFKETQWQARLLVLVFILALIFWSTPAKADDWLTVTVGSYHRDRDRGYNEFNYGIGVERELPYRHWRFAGGVYENSYYHTTWYALGVRELWSTGNWKFGVAVGGATGYSHTVDGIVAPFVAWEGKRFGINLLPFTPKVVGLQVKMRF